MVFIWQFLSICFLMGQVCAFTSRRVSLRKDDFASKAFIFKNFSKAELTDQFEKLTQKSKALCKKHFELRQKAVLLKECIYNLELTLNRTTVPQKAVDCFTLVENRIAQKLIAIQDALLQLEGQKKNLVLLLEVTHQ